MRALQINSIRVLAFVVLGTLAGCGVDGEPIQPNVNVGVGVSSNGGVRVGGGVGVYKGPISLFFGF